ncbi:tripartite tricarboxylate transporter substrate binding protein [Variovorax paradoxus]|uniref:Bug family tripartite tricarboxylate transporter substrate binding protein n=1 Tax=Variovorax paradoxus TaxID=34073 RepID=UPI003ECD3697
MNPHRRSTVRLVAAMAAGALPFARAQAQPFPSKLIRIVVPLAPGGSADSMARLVAAGIARVLGQSVIVDNKPGAGGLNGMAEVARAPRDGYTLGYSLAGALTVANHIALKMPYDPAKDFAPITQVVAVPEIIVVNPKLGVTSLQQLVALAKAKPGTLNFGSAGNATIPHLGGELFKREAAIDIVHVPYRGTGPALNDLVAGQVHMMVADVTLVRAHIETGRLVPLAVAGPRRIAVLPAVPTTAEADLPDVQVSNWHTLVAPAGTPAEVVGRLREAVQRAMALPEVQSRLAQEGAEAVIGTPAQTVAFLDKERARWGTLVKKLGIRWD